MNKKFSQSLPVPVSQEELSKLCIELGRSCVRKAELEEEKKKVSSEFNEQIKALQEKIDEESAIAATGSIYRQVECQMYPNYPAKVVQIIRLDTGEVVEERNMSDEELAHIDMNLDNE